MSGLNQAPRKKAFVRSHSRAADVALLKVLGRAGAVFVALCVFSVLPFDVSSRRWRRRRRDATHRAPSSSSTASRTCCGRRRGIASGPSASGRSPQH